MTKQGRILILGATSAIAQAYARKRAIEHVAFVLVGRREDRLEAVSADLIARGAASTNTVVLDLVAIDSIDDSAQMLWSRFGDIDQVLIAYGVLGSQSDAEANTTIARSVFDTNLTSVALWMLAILRQRSASAPMTIIAIGSVAGDRGRASNFVYGQPREASKDF